LLNSAANIAAGIADLLHRSTTSEQLPLQAPAGPVTRGWRARALDDRPAPLTTAGSTRPAATDGGGTPSPAAALGVGAAVTGGVVLGRPGDDGATGLRRVVGTSTTTCPAAADRPTTGAVHRPTPTNIATKW